MYVVNEGKARLRWIASAAFAGIGLASQNRSRCRWASVAVEPVGTVIAERGRREDTHR